MHIDHKPKLTPEQIKQIEDLWLNIIQMSMPGNGELTMTIRKGKISYMVPAPHIDTFEYPPEAK